MKRLLIRVRGSVQGVGFRVSAMVLAEELGLSGSARNDPDESVVIEVEGEDRPVGQFLIWCESGPIHAEVKTIDHTEVPTQEQSGFHIIT